MPQEFNIAGKNIPMTGVERQLHDGLEGLSLVLSPAQFEQLTAYLHLLAKWNKTYNLTAIRRESDMVSHHLLDSLAILPYLNGREILDVGTGAGLPGLVLAIALPDRSFSLLDSNSKKTRFCTQAVIELGLDNVDVTCARIEAYQPPQGKVFDTVVTRAFASIDDTLSGLKHLLRPETELLLMKGQHPGQETGAIHGFTLNSAVHRLEIPGLQEERHLLVLRDISVA